MPTSVYESRGDEYPHVLFKVRAGSTYERTWRMERQLEDESWVQIDYTVASGGYTANGYFMEIAETEGGDPVYVVTTVDVPSTTDVGDVAIVIPSSTTQEMWDLYKPAMWGSVFATKPVAGDDDPRKLIMTGSIGILPA